MPKFTYAIVSRNIEEYEDMIDSGGTTPERSPSLFEKWYSEEEIKTAIFECYSYGHAEPLTEYYNNKDDNLICIAELEENLFGLGDN